MMAAVFGVAMLCIVIAMLSMGAVLDRLVGRSDFVYCSASSGYPIARAFAPQQSENVNQRSQLI